MSRSPSFCELLNSFNAIKHLLPHAYRQVSADTPPSPRKRQSAKQRSIEPAEAITDKFSFVQSIERHGGTIIQADDLFDIIGSEGGGAIEVTFPSDAFFGIHSIVLVSDRPSTTPKFLTALALEIPCVSRQFVVESIARVDSISSRMPAFL